MLISNEEVNKRLASPLNLINKMASAKPTSPARSKAMSLFGVGSVSRSTASAPVETATQTKTVQTKTAIAETTISPEKKPTFVIPNMKVNNDTVIITPEVLLEANGPELDSILDNAVARVGIDTAHQEALDTLIQTVKKIKLTIDTVDRPDKLADIAAKMSKVVTDIRKERMEAREKNQHVHHHFYTPEQRSLDSYEVVQG